VGDTYTHGHHESVLRSHRWRTAENSAGYLLPFLSPGLRLLDVGCGPGTITVDLAARVAPGATVGVDREAAVIAEARALLESRPIAPVEFRTADATRSSSMTRHLTSSTRTNCSSISPIPLLR
jgi:2-polyprenyl-3-methyl-5-hydroxy-6-metoxy-1,4-benzoquinol methylase